jgi:acetyl/propionyl-CoA carboxylase alpha subunit
VVTNLPFLRALVRSDAVRDAAFDTEWIEREFLAQFSALASAPAPDLVFAVAAVAEAMGAGRPGAARAHASGGATVRPGAFTSLGRWRLPGLDT